MDTLEHAVHYMVLNCNYDKKNPHFSSHGGFEKLSALPKATQLTKGRPRPRTTSGFGSGC